MAHFTHNGTGWLVNKTPYQVGNEGSRAERIAATLAQDELTRSRPAPSLAWQAEIDGFRAVGGVKFDARIRA